MANLTLEEDYSPLEGESTDEVGRRGGPLLFGTFEPPTNRPSAD